jgi:acetyltransferase EpsM
MNTQKLVIIGGEGNGGVIASCIEDNRQRFGDHTYAVAGFVNDYLNPGTLLNGYKVLGGLKDLPSLLSQDYIFSWAIHMVGQGPLRKKLFEQTSIPDDRLAVVVHNSSFVASNAKLDPGAFVMSNSYIGPMAHIGKCSLVMANNIIGHNTKIGPLCHFSAGAITSSYVSIGTASDICLGSRVIEKVRMGDFSVAGASSLVLKDVPSKEVHVGIPAKFSRFITES